MIPSLHHPRFRAEVAEVRYAAYCTKVIAPPQAAHTISAPAPIAIDTPLPHYRPGRAIASSEHAGLKFSDAKCNRECHGRPSRAACQSSGGQRVAVKFEDYSEFLICFL